MMQRLQIGSGRSSMVATLYGFHAVSSRLRRHPDSIKEIYLDAARRDGRAKALAELAAGGDLRVIPVDAERLSRWVGGAPHQGVVAFVEPVRLMVHLDDLLEDLREPALLLIL